MSDRKTLHQRREDAILYLSAVIGCLSRCSDSDMPSEVDMASAALHQLAIGMRIEIENLKAEKNWPRKIEFPV